MHRSLTLLMELEAWLTVPFNLLHLAHLDAPSQPERAARLLGATERIQSEAGTPFHADPEAGRLTLERSLEEALGKARFAAARSSGAALSRPEAVALALEKSENSGCLSENS